MQVGLSVVAADALARSYFFRDHLPVAVARPFNLIGPGQSTAFVCGRIISQIVRIEEGYQDSLELNSVETGRDFIDVRDVVRAYWSILDHEEFEEVCSGRAFNVGSGRCTTISEILQVLEQITGKQIPLRITGSGPGISSSPRRVILDSSRDRQDGVQ